MFSLFKACEDFTFSRLSVNSAGSSLGGIGVVPAEIGGARFVLEVNLAGEVGLKIFIIEF